MNYITQKQLTFRKLSELQSQLQRIESELPSPTELSNLAEEYEEKSENNSNVIFALLLHTSCLKISEARLAVLAQDFENLKPELFALIDETENDADNLSVNTAFDVCITMIGQLESQISAQIRQIGYLIHAIGIDIATERVNTTLTSTDLLDAARSLHLIR